MRRNNLLFFSFLMFLWGGVLGPPLVLAAENGPALYKDLCVGCHGESGKGDGPAAVGINPKPKDFTDCDVMAKVSNETAFKAIKGGGQSVGVSPMMPSWSSALEDPQIKELITYIRSFCKK